jgi:hypothetical protein
MKKKPFTYVMLVTLVLSMVMTVVPAFATTKEDDVDFYLTTMANRRLSMLVQASWRISAARRVSKPWSITSSGKLSTVPGLKGAPSAV